MCLVFFWKANVIMKFFKQAVIAFGLLLGMGSAAFAQATDWPKKPIRVVISFPPGGATDVLTRAISQPLSDALGQPIVVENRPGAGGMLGLGAVAKSDPDGYTVHLSALTNQAIAQGLFTNAPADLRKDFVPIGLVGTSPHVLVVHPSVPAKTVPELINWIKAQKGNLNYASQGNGTLSHLESELMLQKIGARAVHIPYKGSSFALPDLIAGTTLMMFDSVAASLPHIKAGKIRPIGLAATERLSLVPDVPTLIEGGVNGFDVDNWFALYAPKGTPAPIVAKFERELQKVLSNQEVRQRLAATGIQLKFENAGRTAAITEAEHKKWADVIKSANVKLN
jgi:tripartite-type tricarboxylate transporter receptor subunit TctC